MRHDRSLLVKDEIWREMAGQFGLRFRLPRKSQGIFYMPEICGMGQTALLPFRRKACCGFFRLKNTTASGSNPRSWLPEGSMITTRPHKPRYNAEEVISVVNYRSSDVRSASRYGGTRAGLWVGQAGPLPRALTSRGRQKGSHRPATR
jgi:hypothetical protein